MKRILITGGTGLIGTPLIKKLQESHNIFTLVRKTVEYTHKHKNVTPLVADFSNDWSIKELPTEIDCIIHLSQSEHFRDFPNHAMEVFSVNTLSTLKLLDYANKTGVKQFIYASSGGVYGNRDEEFNEDTPILSHNGLGFYLSTKLCSEILVENYKSLFDTVMLRFFFVYGREQRRTMLIPRLVDSVKMGKPITIQGKEGIKINPIHVDDAVNALIEVLNLKGSHKINIAGPEAYSLKEIANMIGELAKKPACFEYQNNQKPQNLIGDIKNMTKLLGAPKTQFQTGVKDLI